MKFNVVIGNPPYNKGMDIDFIALGTKLSSRYCSMVVPAKWATANGNQAIVSNIGYQKFRDEIARHMSYVCYYPDTSDVFNIRVYSGITYFLIDHSKDINDTTVIENRSRMIKEFNSIESRDLSSLKTLNNFGEKVIKHVEEFPKFYTMQLYGRYQVWITDTYDTSSHGYCLVRSDGKTGVLCPSRIIDSEIETNTIGTAKLIFASDSKQECESFVSWLYTKFTRFFILLAVDGFHIGAGEYYYRFVPSPPNDKFDHIFTDAELYEHFNMPIEFIEAIENIISEKAKS